MLDVVGELAFEMAKTKKCEVTGITLSKNQLDYCKKKAKELNLDNQVKFEINGLQKCYRSI